MKLAVPSLALAGCVLALVGANEPDAVQRILNEGLRSDGAYRKLAWLCDRIGPRLSGSENLEKAVAWCAAEMKRDGLDNVHTERVMVPHWVRGEARGRILAPTPHPMAILALGMSDGTKPQGITADIVEVKSVLELKELGERAKGKIVLCNIDIELLQKPDQNRKRDAMRNQDDGQ